ncbi:hypothetical protein [Sulfitobacter sp. MF3-043]|uniref:hypothetical protein n=1 Tax=Sulfitobacter sediminivivens TaxID=3252902 RepID=UPI0036D9DB5E
MSVVGGKLFIVATRVHTLSDGVISPVVGFVVSSAFIILKFFDHVRRWLTIAGWFPISGQEKIKWQFATLSAASHLVRGGAMPQIGEVTMRLEPRQFGPIGRPILAPLCLVRQRAHVKATMIFETGDFHAVTLLHGKD